MIQSAMMFALGFLVSGLLWLALSVALVRRARRLTERRLLAGVSTRRAEFESERDELRARHAVQMYRLEREVSRVLDMATAHRLEADVNEHDLASLKAELAGRDQDLQELQGRLDAEQEITQALERRYAEAGAALRSTQHALQLEISRREMTEEALDRAGYAVAERRRANGGATAANDAAIIADSMPEESTDSPHVLLPFDTAVVAAEPSTGGSVVPMPTRHRAAVAETPEQSAALVAEAARNLHRLAGEAHAELDTAVWNAAAAPEPRMPVAAAPGEASVAELAAHRQGTPASAGTDGQPEKREASETRFFEALAEIRALRRTANQAGE